MWREGRLGEYEAQAEERRVLIDGLVAVALIVGAVVLIWR